MSHVELIEMQGSNGVLALVAVLLVLGCFLYATGVFALIRDAHRAGVQRVRDDRGGPLRRVRRQLTTDYPHGEATSWHRGE